MAGPREQSADTSLDDILSSIRKIVSDDLSGAEQLREKLADAQAAAAEMSARTLPEPHGRAEHAHQSLSNGQGAQNQDNTAALVAAARAAAGTPAREFVASEPQPSQAEVAPPRESLAPFDRSTTAEPHPETISDLGTDLGAPIVLPTEAEPSLDVSMHQAEAVSAEPTDTSVETTGHDQQFAASDEPFELEAGADGLVNGHVNGTEPLGGTGNVNGQANGHACMNGMATGEAPMNGSALAPDVDVTPVMEAVPAAEPPQPVVEPAVKPETSETAAPAPHVPGISSKLLEQTVTRMLRPMLKDWLDENMPRLIEQALRDEPADTSPDGQT